MKTIDEIARKCANSLETIRPDDLFDEKRRDLMVPFIKQAILEATQELQKDKERLDWLENNKAQSWYEGQDKWTCQKIEQFDKDKIASQRRKSVVIQPTRPTLREAIDAAITQQQKEKGRE